MNLPDWSWLLLAYVVMSLITMAIYAFDKRAARRNTRRIPERTLHSLALFFGWPGALAAQQIVKHKRQKNGFVLTTWFIAAIHVIALVLLIGEGV